MPEKFKVSKFGTHPTCATYDIDAVERAFMQTELYSVIERHPSVWPLNKPSLNDGALNGTYCSSYNHLVRTQGLSIWGVPGGRPKRSNLDGAIKQQIIQGRKDLRPEAYHLFPDTDEPRSVRLSKMWSKPEKEKKEWLRAVLAARTDGGKTYEDYDIEPSALSRSNSTKTKRRDRRRRRGGNNIAEASTRDFDNNYVEAEGEESVEEDSVAGEDEREPDEGEGEGEDEDEDNEDEDESNAEMEGGASGEADSIASSEVQESNRGSAEQRSISTKTKRKDRRRRRGSNNVAEVSVGDFDDTHAVFLISFGREAAESALVERCVLSLRRRGAWDGHVVVLTDAPAERYAGEWDDNVIVMHPREEHLKAADGTPIKFTRENLSLKPKRFKTFIIDYVDADKRLDSVELIYYLDIDIMAGNAMGALFGGVEGKYEVSREERPEGRSRLYFFTPLSKEWPLQGGTFIVERRSSRHCLELWRDEIDRLTVSGRGRDQDALRTVHGRIEAGDESKCQLVKMKNENYISFPTPRTFKKMTRQPSPPNLVHISNSVFAKWIDEGAQNEYIGSLLELTEEERASGKYSQVTVSNKKSDM